MADCKACGAWFGTVTPQDLCPTCERALNRLNGYATPVVHGRWVKNIRGNYAKVCSECGTGILTNEYTPILLDCNRASDEREQTCDLADVVKYCPNCGAKMDEVSE